MHLVHRYFEHIFFSETGNIFLQFFQSITPQCFLRANFPLFHDVPFVANKQHAAVVKIFFYAKTLQLLLIYDFDELKCNQAS